MTLRELYDKQVVQVESGVCLGRVDDLEFDETTARISRLVMLGKPRLFGLLGRAESLYIPWQEIQRIGVDTILVTTELPPGPPPAPHWRWPWEW